LVSRADVPGFNAIDLSVDGGSLCQFERLFQAQRRTFPNVTHLNADGSDAEEIFLHEKPKTSSNSTPESLKVAIKVQRCKKF
jgi:hypothetical protein